MRKAVRRAGDETSSGQSHCGTRGMRLSASANGVTTFFRVVLPLSVPGIVSGVTMVFVPSITAFTVPALIGNGAYMLYGNKIETAITSAAGYHRNDYSVGSTLSIILLLCIVISTLIMNHFDKDKEGGSIL